MDNIKIRLETPIDERVVEEITREAFWNLYTLGASEHFMVHKLRKSADFVKNLSFVATIDDKVVGSIFYSISQVTDSKGKVFPTLTFAPVSVAKGFQGQGIGSKLIEHSLSITLKEKLQPVIILGDNNYYKRFGFVSGKQYNISAEDGNFYKNLLVYGNKKYFNKMDGTGTFTFSPVFNVTPEEVEEFDKSFPPKIKRRTESQEIFEKTAFLIDEE